MKLTLSFSSLIVSIALLGCLLPLSYGYYMLIRFVTMVLAVCWWYKFLQIGARSLAVVAGAIALLFQPFFKIVLDRLIWNIVDVVVAIVLLFWVWRYILK
jgi:hypothetical protein